MLWRATISGGLLLLCVGCGPQALYDSSVTVTRNDIKPILFGPFKKETTVKVEVEAVGPPISIYIHPEDQTEHVDYAISMENEPPSFLAGSDSVEEASYEFTVPADTEMAVRLQGSSQEESLVKLKILK